MRLEDIQYALAIGRTGGVARAAQQLGISQPAMSKALARLEAELKTQLFSRNARGVELTDDGRLFLEHAALAAMHAEDARAALRDRRQGISGLVRLGVGIGVAAHPLAEACAALVAKGSGRKTAGKAGGSAGDNAGGTSSVRFEMRSGLTDSLLAALRNGELDLIISGIPQPAGEELAWVPLWPDPMLPYLPRQHALAGQPQQWTLPVFSEQRWVLPPVGTVARSRFDSAFISAGLAPPVPVLESRASGKEVDLALALNAIALMPLSLASDPGGAAYMQSQFVRVLSLPALRLERTISLLSRRAAYLSPVVLRFMSLMESRAAPLAKAGR